MSGTYLILIGDFSIDDTGGYTFYLQRLNNPSDATAVNFNDVVTGSIDAKVAHDAYLFEGQAGDVVRFDIARTSGAYNPDLDVYRPDGSLLCADHTPGSVLSEECRLDVSGTYLILIGDFSIDDTGGYSFSLKKVT